MLYQELSSKILKAYFEVLKNLGTGFLESVYENALCIEFDELNIPYVSKLVPAHSAQLINYLTLTQCKVGLLLNFGEGRDYKRVYLKD